MLKTVLVTGATKGIGLAISEALNNSGYFVIGIARFDKVNFPGKLYKCDLSDIKETEYILQKIKQEFTNISYIVNNVGITLPQSFGEIDLNSLNSVFDLNVRVSVQIAQEFLEQMKIRKYGRIVNITSLSIVGRKNRSSYVASKSALVGLTRTWALELAPLGITVNSIAPGPVDTELFRKNAPIGSDAEKEALSQIPLGRIGRAEEIAAVVKFILSDEAAFITGQNICVDGGASIG